ncbi:MAG: WbqC family protein [Candidatus Dormibacteraceae bacterium]
MARRRRERKPGLPADPRPPRTVAIVQSNYIPWKGYFDLIARADCFILFDDRQYTRRDWRNRNRIKSPGGPRWLTIPVESSGRYLQRIDETRISDPAWAEGHWQAIASAYANSNQFATERPWLEALYREPQPELLSHVNRRFLEAISARLGIRATLAWSTDFDVVGGRTERLVNLCLAAGATRYLSGPAARVYLEEERFAEAGIDLEYMDYGGYPEYDQPHPPFVHEVSIVDLIMSTGPAAARHLKAVPAIG